MAERIRKPRTVVKKNTRTEVMDQPASKSEVRRKAIQQEMDDMLEDIDGVLEENAQAFIDSFVQKGGE
jgi:ubiquitin-like protein Pup